MAGVGLNEPRVPRTVKGDGRFCLPPDLATEWDRRFLHLTLTASLSTCEETGRSFFLDLLLRIGESALAPLCRH